MDYSQVEIPTHCKAGVVVNEGPEFHVEVQMVPVPQPGMTPIFIGVSTILVHTSWRPLILLYRPRRCFDQAELHWTLLVRHPYDARRPRSPVHVSIWCAISGT